MSYLNRTHGTCVYFFFLATGIRRVSAHQPPFLAPRDAFSGSAGRSEVPSFSRDEASRAGVPPSCPSRTWSPALIVSAFSKKEKKKRSLYLHLSIPCTMKITVICVCITHPGKILLLSNLWNDTVDSRFV